MKKLINVAMVVLPLVFSACVPKIDYEPNKNYDIDK